MTGSIFFKSIAPKGLNDESIFNSFLWILILNICLFISCMGIQWDLSERFPVQLQKKSPVEHQYLQWDIQNICYVKCQLCDITTTTTTCLCWSLTCCLTMPSKSQWLMPHNKINREDLVCCRRFCWVYLGNTSLFCILYVCHIYILPKAIWHFARMILDLVCNSECFALSITFIPINRHV